MTDLISKVDKMVEDDLNSVQELVTKYTAVLQDIFPKKNIPYIAYLINVSVLYLNGSHGATNKDWKTWATLLIKKSFEDGNLVNDEDIVPLIDEFLEYKEKEYDNWCKDNVSVTDHDRDRGFFYGFYWKKNR